MCLRGIDTKDLAVADHGSDEAAPWHDNIGNRIFPHPETPVVKGTFSGALSCGDRTLGGSQKKESSEPKDSQQNAEKNQQKKPEAKDQVSVADNFSDAYRSTTAQASTLDSVSVADNFNQKAGAGINLGNALEAPREGDWGVVLKPEYFRAIKEAGFSNVRLPVRWSAHASYQPPYTIDPQFMARVDWAIEQARANGLEVVMDMHHFEDLENNPEGSKQRFLGMWKQIAEHYKDQPNDLAFELYNEPSKNITADKWNELSAQALEVVRASNPTRCIVVGPVEWNNINQLPSLKLPESDRNLLVTFHYYEPFHFTHQGASWVGGSNQWLGTKWTGSPAETSNLHASFEKAAKWGQEHDRPMYLGEFGSISNADMDSRARWTRAVQTEARSHGMSSSYWEFCSMFGAYDPYSNRWRAPLLDALTRGEASFPEPPPLPRPEPRPQPNPEVHPQPGPGPYPQPDGDRHPTPGPEPYPQPGPSPYPQPDGDRHPTPGPEPYPEPYPGPGPDSPWQPYPEPIYQPRQQHPSDWNSLSLWISRWRELIQHEISLIARLFEAMQSSLDLLNSEFINLRKHYSQRTSDFGNDPYVDTLPALNLQEGSPLGSRRFEKTGVRNDPYAYAQDRLPGLILQDAGNLRLCRN
jgi:endoglucanase